MSRTASQRWRVLFATVYALVFLAVSRLTAGWPGLDVHSVWFWSGGLLVLIGAALAEPFFSTPANAVANGAAILLGALAFASGDAGSLGLTDRQLNSGKAVVAGYGALVVSIGLILAIVKGPAGAPRNTHPLNVFALRLLSRLGSAKWVYSVALIGAAVAEFNTSSRDLLTVLAAWFVVVVVRPIEWLYENLPTRRSVTAVAPVAQVVGLRNPCLVELDCAESGAFDRGDLFAGSGCEVEVLERASSSSGSWALASLRSGVLPQVGAMVTLQGSEPEPAVGYTDDGSSLGLLRFSLAVGVDGMASGDLVAAKLGAVQGLYQVVDARVRTTSIDKDVARSHVLVDAVSVGTWSPDLGRFVPTDWLPEGGTVVRRLPKVDEPLSAEAIGHVPNTSFSVEALMPTMVTHSAAVLGVLGSGKSTLARELILRAARAGVKVLIIDASPEHADHLAPFLGEPPNEIAGRFNAALDPLESQTAQAQELGGNRAKFSELVRQDLDSFLVACDPVRAYDLSQFHVTKQVSWKDKSSGKAEFAECTLPELSALVAEAAFDAVKAKGFGPARLWVCLEEGHQLIPEFNSIGAKDDDKHAQRTTKVFLQGRKYGLGALVVTQRTANVSKSLLTQCNTVFCFRAHDETTANFLRERAGPLHVAALASLPDRRVLAFGRALGAEDPVFLRVNDSDSIRTLLFPPDGQIDDEDMAGGIESAVLCWCPADAPGHAPHGELDFEHPWGGP